MMLLKLDLREVRLGHIKWQPAMLQRRRLERRHRLSTRCFTDGSNMLCGTKIFGARVTCDGEDDSDGIGSEVDDRVDRAKIKTNE